METNGHHRFVIGNPGHGKRGSGRSPERPGLLRRLRLGTARFLRSLATRLEAKAGRK